jgi:hypothetical protein
MKRQPVMLTAGGEWRQHTGWAARPFLRTHGGALGGRDSPITAPTTYVALLREYHGCRERAPIMIMARFSRVPTGCTAMEDVNECFDALAAASYPLDLTDRVALTHRRASIRPVSGDCVVQLGYADDPRGMGYAVAS